MWAVAECKSLCQCLCEFRAKTQCKNASHIFAKVEVFLMVSKQKFFEKSQEEGDHSQPTSLCFQFLVRYRGSLFSEDLCI